MGGNEQIRVDVRIIAASNQDLVELIKLGRFRDDLYFRLNVLCVELPPLRARKEDIPHLVKHFIGLFNKKLGRSVETVTERAMKALLAYDWPGNVRELENVVERAMNITNSEVIDVSHLPSSVVQRSPSLLVEGANLKSLEINAIWSAISACNGNISRAAKRLGIGRSTIYRKLRKTSGGFR